MQTIGKSTLSLLLLLLLASCSISGDSKAVITDLQPDAFLDMMSQENFILIDARSLEEYEAGHIGGARVINVLSDDFTSQINKLDHEKICLVYSRSGRRSAEAAAKMRDAGFKKIYNLVGGITRWRAGHLPVKTD